MILLAPLALAGLAVAAGVRIVRVEDEEMSPTLRPGDLVLVAPGRPAPGDVALLEDPAEPGRLVLRRLLAGPGQRFAYRAGVPVVDGHALRQREMGRDAEGIVLSEANLWLTRHPLGAQRFRLPTLRVPANGWAVLADQRARAVDSRWWGPIPEAALRGIVWFRIGPPDAWRGVFAWRGRDGPWAIRGRFRQAPAR